MTIGLETWLRTRVGTMLPYAALNFTRLPTAPAGDL